MIKIGVLGDIGSGKSYVANSFGYPVFNADKEVSKLYKSDKKIFYKLKKIQLPLDYKKKKSNFIIKNDFRKTTVRKYVKDIIKEILNERNRIRY